jgi:tetratricopeptide (TPR) repeat protein
MLPVVLKYVRLMLGIPPFFIDYSYLRGGYNFLSAPVLGGLALLVVLVAGGVVAWRAPKWRVAGFGLIWAALFLLPVSNLLPMKQYLAERFLYLPLVGWLIAAGTVAAVARQQKASQVVWVGLLLLWGVTAWNRSWIWQDALTLFVRSCQEGPKTPRVQDNAIAAILRLPHIERSFKLENGRLSMIGNIDPASLDQVERTFAEALELFPENHTMLSALGITLATKGQPQLAVPYFEKSATLQPKDVGAWLNLARATLAANQLRQTRSALDHVFALDPQNAMALALLFECQWRAGDFSAARETATRWNEMVHDEQSARALEKVEKKLQEQNGGAVTTAGTPP